MELTKYKAKLERKKQTKLNNEYKDKVIYAYIWPDNSCYVGKSSNIKKRIAQHLKENDTMKYGYDINKAIYREIYRVPVQIQQQHKEYTYKNYLHMLEGYYWYKMFDQGYKMLNRCPVNNWVVRYFNGNK
jgi:predicted GIY-YIG superfamily endonuclease